MESMELYTKPWECGDSACKDQWHKATYYTSLNSTGKRNTYTLDHHSDGDHEPIRAKDLPKQKQVDEAWLSYFQYVARTGKDPLHEFEAKSTNTTHYQALVKQGSDRIILKGVRLKGKMPWIGLKKKIPKEVRDYLCVPNRPRYSMSVDPNNLKTLDDLSKVIQAGDITIRKVDAVIDFSVDITSQPKGKELRNFLKGKGQLALNTIRNNNPWDLQKRRPKICLNYIT